MADTVGIKSLAFAGLSMKYAAEDGYDMDGKSVPAVNVTADDASNMTYAAGDKPDFGQLKATVLIDSDSIEEILALVGSTATLTLSYNIANGSSNITNATVVGSAILLSYAETHRVNTAVKAAAVFQWVTAPTYTNAAA
jgi:hypothetical protein